MARIESLSEYEKYKEEKENRKPFNRVTGIIIAIVVSIILGVGTYLISNSLMSKEEPEKEETSLGEELSLNDENTQILYRYVTYGAEGKRNPKYVENEEVTLTSFTEEEKLYYALQFAQPEDFEFTGEKDENKNKIYTIPLDKIIYYMRLYFGPNVTYQPISKITYPFTFQINKKNVGTLTYNQSRNGYDTIFASYEDYKDVLDTVDGKLVSAIRKPDGKIILQERVVYKELRTDNGKYAIDIYKDYKKTTKLDSKTELEEYQLNQVSIDLSAYAQTTIIEYTFGVNNGTCYFESSRMIS